MTNIQKYALVFAVMFFFIALLGYIPGFTDDNGLLFGLFSLQLHDDLLHLGSGIWAMIAGLHSTRQSIYYFKIFGIIYGLDGVLGLITGLGYLDLGILLHDPVTLDFVTRFGANIPHIIIGGLAIFAGFVLGKRFDVVKSN